MSGEITYTIPVAGVTPGPTYAVLVDTALTAIQTHNHDGLDDGSQIDISKQLITQDLQLDGYNLGTVRSIEFNSQPSQLVGEGDVNALYVNQNNLGFNNSNGIFVPITSGNTLAITSLSLTNWSSRTIVSSAVILPTDTYNLINVNSASAVTITLPVAALITPIAANRLFLIEDTLFNASTFNITIQVTPSSGNTFATGATSISIVNNGGYIGVYTDGVGTWYIWTQNMYNAGEQINSLGAAWNLSGGSFFLEGVTCNFDSSNIITNNGSFDQNGIASFNGDVFFNSPVVFGIVATIHSTAAVTLTSQTTTVASGTLALTASALDLDHFSSLVISGGSFSNSGATTLSGLTTITNPTIVSGMTLTGGGSITGNVTFTGGTLTIDDNVNINASTIFTANTGINVHTNSFIQLDNSAVLETDGLFKNMGPNRIGVNLIAYGNYSINPATDYYIAVDTSLSGFTQITFPATPTTGDTYKIGDAADNLSGATIQLLGNGHNFLAPGGSSSYGYAHTNGLVLNWTFANNCWVIT